MTVVQLPEAATTLAAVAVSVEPEGGSLQPTTKPIAMVTLQVAIQAAASTVYSASYLFSREPRLKERNP